MVFSTIKKPCKYYQTNNLVETAIEYFMATFACYLECEATQAQLQVKVIECFSSKIGPNKIIKIEIEMFLLFSLQTVAHHHWKKQQHNIEPQCTASGVAKKPGNNPAKTFRN